MPPDYLQAAPVLAFVACGADEFGIRPRAMRRDTQPGESCQNQAARTQPRGLPGTVMALPLHRPAGCDAQGPVSGISASESQPFVAAKADPGQGNKPLQAGGDGQQGHEHETRQK